MCDCNVHARDLDLLYPLRLDLITYFSVLRVKWSNILKDRSHLEVISVIHVYLFIYSGITWTLDSVLVCLLTASYWERYHSDTMLGITNFHK